MPRINLDKMDSLVPPLRMHQLGILPRALEEMNSRHHWCLTRPWLFNLLLSWSD